nr:hypothetical protein [Tanacetum cinerariifolium]
MYQTVLEYSCCQAHGDVTRLQALVDKKKIVIFEDAIREILQLDDAEGVVCLPNDEIFTGLAQMGYEKPSTKLTFYKAFFSSQWKFLIHTILQSLSAKRTSWNEFSTAMASAVICLSKGQRFNFLRYIFDSLVRNVDSSSKFYMYPHFIQLIIQAQVVDFSSHTTRYISLDLTQKVFANIRRVRKGCSGIETPLFENMLEIREIDAEEEVQVPTHDDVDQENVVEEIVDDVPQPTSPLPQSPIIPPTPPYQSPRTSPSQAAEGTSFLVQRLKKVGTSQRIESSEDEENVFNQGRKSVDIDEGIELVDDQEKDVQEDSEVQEVVDVLNATKLITEVVTAATAQVIPAAEPVVATVTKDAQATDVQSKDAPAKGIQYIRRYHGYKKKPQSKSKARKNMIDYLKNTDGFKMAFFKGKTYDQIRTIFQARVDANMRFLLKSKEEMEKEEDEIIKSINETPAQKAAKRRRLREQAKEAEDLKKQLEVVADEDDDVFVEATPIGTKVPVVNYE